VSGAGTSISASANEIVVNDWGFRLGQKGKVEFRRHIGAIPPEQHQTAKGGERKE